MKYSGIAVFIIGVCILGFCLIASVTAGQTGADGVSNRTDLLFPVIVGAAALAAGGVMYLYGGRGFISTRNPAIRN